MNPSLSGSVVLHFALAPDDPNTPQNESFWYFNGQTSAIGLSVPSVFEITTATTGNLNWSNPANWNVFPLDTSQLSISETGNGSYTVVVNNGSPNLNVLQNGGPTEGTVQTYVSFPTVLNGEGFILSSNIVNTRYNVTLPSGAHLNFDQIPTLQNLTVNAGASVNNGGFSITVRQNITNHGSGDFNAVVGGNFANDAVATSGNVANATHLEISGQLTNTGQLFVPGYLSTSAATGNVGTMKINGGDFIAGAAFNNTGSLEFAGGNIYGPGTITNNGTFQWTAGGGIRATAAINNATSSFTIGGTDGGGKFLEGTLNNSGTITQSGGTNLEISGGTLNNQAGALYDITDDSHVSYAHTGVFNNAGTLRKSGGSGISHVGLAAINNTGTIAVTSGTLRFRGGGTLNGGTMNFTGGHTVELLAGNFALQGTNSAAGNGALEINGGHVFADSGNSSSFGNFTGGANLLVTAGTLDAKLGGTLTLNLTGSSKVQITGNPGASGGTIGGPGTTTNTGNFEWLHGVVAGNLTNASLNFTIVAGDQNVSGGLLTNGGTITQSADSNLRLEVGGAMINQAGGIWNTTGTNSISAGFQAGAISNEGTWRKSGGSTTSNLSSPFNNSGTLAIDSGKLFVVGSDTLNLMSAGKLAFKLAGLVPMVDFGRLEGQSSLTAGGTLVVTLASGFMPALGNSFDLVDWGSISTFNGAFTQLQLPALASGLKWDSSQLYTSGVLSVGVGIPGDFNQNGVVDAADFVVWRNELGATYTQSDYGIWRAHFGQTAGSGAANNLPQRQPVPEPSGMLIAAIACLTAGAATARRRKASEN